MSSSVGKYDFIYEFWTSIWFGCELYGFLRGVLNWLWVNRRKSYGYGALALETFPSIRLDTTIHIFYTVPASLHLSSSSLRQRPFPPYPHQHISYYDSGTINTKLVLNQRLQG